MVLKNVTAPTPTRTIVFKKTTSTTPIPLVKGFDINYVKPTIATPSVAKIVNNNSQLSINLQKQVQDILEKQKADMPKITIDTITKIQFSTATNDIIKNAINGIEKINVTINKAKSTLPANIADDI